MKALADMQNPAPKLGAVLFLVWTLACGCDSAPPSAVTLPETPDPEKLFEYAKLLIDRAAALAPEERTLHVYYSGRVDERFGLEDEALSRYREALEIDPTFGEIYRRIGYILSLRKDGLAEAVDAYQASLRYDWAQDGVFTRIGLVLSHAGRTEEAIAAYEAEVRRGGADDFTWYNLGHAQSLLGRHEEATASFRRALETNPEQREALHGMAMSLKALGKQAEAKPFDERFRRIRDAAEAADRSAKASADDVAQQREHVAESWLDAAHIFVSAHNRAVEAKNTRRAAEMRREAIRAAERAVDFAPSLPRAHEVRFEVATGSGDRSAILAAAKGWAAAFPDSAEVQYRLARAYLDALSSPTSTATAGAEQQEQVTGAASALKRTLELSPRLGEAHLSLAQLHLFHVRAPNSPQLARRHAEQALELAKTPTEAHFDLLAFAHVQSGDAESAIATLRRGLEVFPTSGQLRQRLERFQSTRGGSR